MIPVKKDKHGQSYVEGTVTITVRAFISNELTEVEERDAREYLENELEDLASNSGCDLLTKAEIKIL